MTRRMRRISLAPISSRIWQRLFGVRPLHSHACESAVLCEPEDQPMLPPLFLPGELERVTGVHEFSAGLDDELWLATRDRVHHSATLAWRLRDVCLADGKLCTHRSYRKLSFGRVPYSPVSLMEVEETTAWCSTDAGNDYFAHFLLDDATTAMLGPAFGRAAFGGNLRPRSPQALEYLTHLDLPYQQARRTLFRDLWMFTDISQNSHRRRRLQELRTRLRAKFSPKLDAAPTYIRRGLTGSPRQLDNDTEIEAMLAARGFRIVEPEARTAAEICSQLQGSPLVVGVEGSQLVHGLLNQRAGGVLLCIQPSARFNAVWRSFANSCDLHWGFVVAEGTAQHFSVPAQRLLATIDLAMERIGHAC